LTAYDYLNARQDFIRGLREIADYYENPSLPVPSLRQLNVSAEDSKEEAERLARLLAPCAKQHGNTVFSLIKVFSGMTLKLCVLAERRLHAKDRRTQGRTRGDPSSAPRGDR